MPERIDPLADLDEYLRRNSLTQTAFAAMIGVTRQTLSNWKTLKYKPGLYQALVLERLCGIPPTAWLVPSEMNRIAEIAAKVA